MEINGDFSRKSQIFPTPVYFAHPLKRFSSELGIGGNESKKTRMMDLAGRTKSLTIFSAVWYNTVTDGRRDGQLDGQTPGDSMQRPRLRIALRGKNIEHTRLYWYSVTRLFTCTLWVLVHTEIEYIIVNIGTVRWVFYVYSVHLAMSQRNSWDELLVLSALRLTTFAGDNESYN